MAGGRTDDGVEGLRHGDVRRRFLQLIQCDASQSSMIEQLGQHLLIVGARQPGSVATGEQTPQRSQFVVGNQIRWQREGGTEAALLHGPVAPPLRKHDLQDGLLDLSCIHRRLAPATRRRGIENPAGLHGFHSAMPGFRWIDPDQDRPRAVRAMYGRCDPIRADSRHFAASWSTA